MNETSQIAITALIAALILLVEHYAPLRPSQTLLRYILGLLGLIVPLSVLLAGWGQWLPLAALWSVVISGGLAVMLAYLVDHYLMLRRRAHVAEMEAQLLRPEVNHAPIDRGTGGLPG